MTGRSLAEEDRSPVPSPSRRDEPAPPRTVQEDRVEASSTPGEQPGASGPAGAPREAGDDPGLVHVSAREMALCLLGLSFATVLFVLAIFKLLSFFIMPSLFFDLLFVGFPLGAFIGAAFFRVSLRSLVRSLWVLQGVTVASVIAILLAKNLDSFDYLRAHLFEVEVGGLLTQMGTFTFLFLPFFAAYGLSEYIGYQVGRRCLKGKMKLVYALYLFGAAGAYIFFRLSLSDLGVARVIAISLACIALSTAVLARGWGRWLGYLEVGALAVVVVLPTGLIQLEGVGSLESQFLELYKGKGFQSTHQYQNDPDLQCEIVYQAWGKYALCEILEDRSGEFHGFYNDFFQWQYRPECGFSERSLGMAPLTLLEPGSSVAIIGAGGGRQVRFAHRLGLRNIVGIEIEPAVFEAVRSPEHLRDAFGGVYEDEGVRPVRSEARGYMEGTEEKFDLIYLPSVGGYPQMMMEPGNLIRTHEAYITIRERLQPDGVLAIWYPRGLDPKNILTEQYVRTLTALGMRTRAYQNQFDSLILAFQDPAAELPPASSMFSIFRPTGPDRIPLPAIPPAQVAHYLPRALDVDPDPQFTPITDDRPFLAGNVRHILSVEQVFQLFAIGGGTLAVAGLAFLFGLSRVGNPQIPRRSYWSVAGLTLLIGANFLVMEHYLVLALFKRTFMYYDSLMMGAISFLILSGLGSLIASPRLRSMFTVLAVISTIVLMAVPSMLSPLAVVALVAPVAVVTGMFFPILFELAHHRPLAVFALDAIGAGIGTLLATFIPITFGFQVFFLLAGALFLLTAVMNWLFHRGLSAPS